MKIGIVSAHKHCKSHIQALQSEGFDVFCLGARPTKIPPSYDVLVVRVASTSHGGEATARAWVKSTGKPAIYEDGLTSIRRELESLRRPVDDDTVVVPTPINKSSVLQALMGCADAFREARPDDGSDALSKTLTKVVYDEYGTALGNGYLSMIPSIVARHFPAGADMAAETIPVDLPASRGPFPADQKWAKVHTPERLAVVYREALDLIAGMFEENISHFMEAYRHCEANPEANMDVTLRSKHTSRKAFYRRRKSIFQGKPMMYAMFIMLQTAEDEAPVKRPFFSTYKDLTGRSSDTRIPDAVAWFLGRPEPIVQTKQHDDKASVLAATATEVGRQNPPGVAPAVPPAVDSNTQAILEVLEDVERLTAKVKALEDFRDTQGPVGSKWEARIESQIKGLQKRIDGRAFVGLADTVTKAEYEEFRREVQRLPAANEVNEMLDVFRADVSAAFDALAKDEDAVRLASDPLAALDQIKKRLAAAGFKGTLTLTIE